MERGNRRREHQRVTCVCGEARARDGFVDQRPVARAVELDASNEGRRHAAIGLMKSAQADVAAFIGVREQGFNKVVNITFIGFEVRRVPVNAGNEILEYFGHSLVP